MTSIDPVTPASPDPRSPMAPPYVDEDPNLALVEEGMEEADTETREAVTDGYEASAILSDDPEAELDDIDFAAADDATAAELDAIYEDTIESGDLDGETDEEV